VSKFSKNERRVLLSTSWGHFFAHALVLIFPSITTPLMEEFGLPSHEIIKLSFFMYLFFGVGALPSGFIADRINPRHGFTLYFFGIGVTSFLTSFTRTAMQLQITLTMLGVFLSFYHPLGIGLISKSIRKRGLALGYNGIFGSVGIASAPFLAGTINYFFGWRSVYLALGIPPLVLGLLTIVRGMEYHEVDQREEIDQMDDSGGKLIRAFIILCGSMMLAGFVYRGQTLLLPRHFEKNVHFLFDLVSRIDFLKVEGTKILSATILTSFVYMIGVIGILIGGKISDSFELRYSYFFIFLLALPFLIMMYFFTDVPLFIASLFFILLLIGMQPVENSLIAHFTPVRWRSTSYGIKFILTFGVSSSVIYPIGFFQTRFSAEAPFLLFSLVLFLLVLNNGFLILMTGKRRVTNLA
jgi:MFS family permease